MSAIQDRIKGFRRVKAATLQDNAGNWRQHPEAQQGVMAAALREVGIVAPLVVYESARQGGLTLIDGHLRKDLTPETEWPVVVLDVDDATADKILATLDPIGTLAEVDAAVLGELLEGLLPDLDENGDLSSFLHGFGEDCGVFPPAFEPISGDDVPRLDEIAPKMATCPECGTEFQL